MRIGIERWAAEKPDEVALVEGGQSLTWREFNERADQLAHGLSQRGVGPGDVVALRMRVRLEWAITAGAVAKLGCTMLGLNWRLTPDECRHVLADSRTTVFLCDDADPSALAPVVASLPIRLAVSLDPPSPGFVAFADIPAADGEPLIAAAEPPLIIYTSGTTGLPKGVVMNRGADPVAIREYRESVEAYRRTRGGPEAGGSVTLINMPAHHGSGPSQFWASVREGGKTVLQRRFVPEEALALIALHRVTTWTAVPTMYKRIAALPAEELARHDVSSVRSLSVGAAPVPVVLKEWIARYFGPGKLQERYGASEVGMISCLPTHMQQLKPGSSGLPHRHVDIEVRDAEGNRMPVGQHGELWIRTPVTIRNYLNQPPLGPDVLDADGFFRVGDIGCVDEDGYLYITDRAKDMIISGGVNIYPAEIEAALLRHPAILDAAVIGIPDDEFGEQVLAFCELKPGHLADPADVLGQCARHLASYKRPRRIEFIPALPRNTMGKLLKRELREPYWKGKGRNV
ncbi:class I adenylate-forming enzyme family protein [Cupriavidus sp. L7L]|uniref:class I adenylate-forming enzyme family protein n=1 Tax=Cupriavidus sp. L7L TaxID=2546443 RepID=UPI0010547A8D|nr:class I adenylate-forming enzyme family protein [Cupriavidus sp. L7L]TDF62219.1 long-chain fatty acid--CoA ligase [Cupriavidus sp. L7L]